MGCKCVATYNLENKFPTYKLIKLEVQRVLVQITWNLHR